ncbi:MAG TPA: hypothetical protein VM735_09350 [Candidatus Kapabacteria bacterium]|nr:hypothetical protein [Candidatus Kapabacteria bacterium]
MVITRATASTILFCTATAVAETVTILDSGKAHQIEVIEKIEKGLEPWAVVEFPAGREQAVPIMRIPYDRTNSFPYVSMNDRLFAINGRPGRLLAIHHAIPMELAHNWQSAPENISYLPWEGIFGKAVFTWRSDVVRPVTVTNIVSAGDNLRIEVLTINTNQAAVVLDRNLKIIESCVDGEFMPIFRKSPASSPGDGWRFGDEMFEDNGRKVKVWFQGLEGEIEARVSINGEEFRWLGPWRPKWVIFQERLFGIAVQDDERVLIREAVRSVLMNDEDVTSSNAGEMEQRYFHGDVLSFSNLAGEQERERGGSLSLGSAKVDQEWIEVEFSGIFEALGQQQVLKFDPLRKVATLKAGDRSWNLSEDQIEPSR